jgi:hypothetical protein
MVISRNHLENNIKSQLSGDLQKNALDFIKYIYKTGGWNHLIQDKPIKQYENVCYPVLNGSDLIIHSYDNGNKILFTNPDAETFKMLKEFTHERKRYINTNKPGVIKPRYILHNPGKRKRPNINEVIDSCLFGGLRNAAVGFVAYVYDNGMKFEPHASNWQEFYLKAKSGERLGQMSIRGADDWRYQPMTVPGDEQYWSFCLYYYTDAYGDFADYAILNEAFHFNIFTYCCFKDDPARTDVNATCLGCRRGADRVIFGIKYKCLCCGAQPSFRNPDETTFNVIKRLLELEKQART